MKKTIFLPFILISIICLSQQVFENQFIFSTSTQGYQVIEIPGQGYFIIGVNDSIAFDSLGQGYQYIQGIIVKLDYNGDTVKTFQIGNGDTLYAYLYGGRNSDDFFRTAIVTDDGNILVGGETQSYNPQSLYDYDLWLLKFNTNLDTLWTNRLSIPDSQLIMYNSLGSKIHNDGIILPGSQDEFNNGNQQFQLSAFDSSGSLIFHQKILPQDYGVLKGVAECSDHGFMAVGYIHNGLPQGNDQSPIVIKTDSMGNEQWHHVLPFSGDLHEAQSITKTQDGNYVYIWGNAIQNAGSALKIWIMHATKINEQGNEIWTRDYGYTRLFLERIRELPNGNLMIAGQYNDTLGTLWQALLLICDSAGNTLWSRKITGADGPSPGSLVTCNDGTFTSDGGYILTGCTSCCHFVPNLGWNSSLWVFKTDSLGLFTSVINLPKPNLNLSSLSEPYPNPAIEQSTINSIIPPETENAELLVFDIHSRQLQEIKLEKGLNETTINLNGYAKGEYIVALSVDGFNAGTKKIVKQ